MGIIILQNNRLTNKNLYKVERLPCNCFIISRIQSSVRKRTG